MMIYITLECDLELGKAFCSKKINGGLKTLKKNHVFAHQAKSAF
jgi:hypothetical protein